MIAGANAKLAAHDAVAFALGRWCRFQSWVLVPSQVIRKVDQAMKVGNFYVLRHFKVTVVGKKREREL